MGTGDGARCHGDRVGGQNMPSRKRESPRITLIPLDPTAKLAAAADQKRALLNFLRTLCGLEPCGRSLPGLPAAKRYWEARTSWSRRRPTAHPLLDISARAPAAVTARRLADTRQRPRLPSNHTSLAILAWGSSSRWPRHSCLRRIAAVLSAAFIGLNRRCNAYVGVHWPINVLAPGRSARS